MRRAWRLAVFLIAAAALALATGLPQPWLVRTAGRLVFGAKFIVTEVSFWNAIRIGRLEVYDPGGGGASPAAVARDVVIDYSVFPFGGSFVQNVEVGTLELLVDAAAESSNISFYRTLTAGSPEGNRATTPRQVTIGSVAVEFRSDGISADLAGFHLFAVAENEDAYSIEIVSEESPGSIQFALPDGTRELAVTRMSFTSVADKRDQAAELAIGLGEGQTASYVFERVGDAPPTNRIELSQLDPAPWLESIAGQRFAEFSMGSVAGTADIVRDDDNGDYEVSMTISVPSVAWREFRFDAITIAGSVGIDEALNRIDIRSVRADADDYLSFFAFSEGVANVEAQTLVTKFDATFDLSTFARSFGNDGLWGEGNINGTLDANAEKIVAGAEFLAEIVGYGNWAAPYRAPLSASVSVDLVPAEDGGTVRDFQASLGQGTRLTVDDFAFSTGPLHLDCQLDFASDLAFLVDARSLDRADAGLRLHADLEVRDDALQGEWALETQIDEIVLRDSAATLTGWKGTAAGKIDDGIGGRGTLHGATLSLAGATVRDIAATPVLENDVLTVTSATATALNGSIVADVRAELFDEQTPIALRATLRDIDLARLTEEVQPPAVELTGIASGNLDLRYTATGLESFSLKASSNKNLTLNRELVEKLLRSDAFASVLGARRLERTLVKLLGDAPQRPFDTGEMNLALKDDRFIGETRLRSKKTSDYNGLNLNVELAIDLPALSEALKLLEQTEGADVEL